MLQNLAETNVQEGGSNVMGALKEEEIEEIDQKDDGYIELVLRVLARMCDGQHRGLQVSVLSILDVENEFLQ